MPSRTRVRVLFAVAAGPAIGFGHLVRARSLSRALGAAPVVALRGTPATRRRAAAAGWQVVDARTDEQVRRFDPDVLVIDDPSPASVRTWTRRARRLGVPVATVHDLGIAAIRSDLLIDGTVKPRRDVHGRSGTLHGPGYAILDPAIREMRVRPPSRAARRRDRVLIALGGGRTAAIAARLAGAIAARVPDVEIRIAAGFMTGARVPALAHGTWVDAPDGLAGELGAASVALLAGGVTLYEACAVGVPAVAIALGPGQAVTTAAIARRGAVRDLGRLRLPMTAAAADHIAREVERLLADAGLRRRLAQSGRRLVDGRGALRVAAQVRRLPAVVSARKARKVSS